MKCDKPFVTTPQKPVTAQDQMKILKPSPGCAQVKGNRVVANDDLAFILPISPCSEGLSGCHPLEKGIRFFNLS